MAAAAAAAPAPGLPPRGGDLGSPRRGQQAEAGARVLQRTAGTGAQKKPEKHNTFPYFYVMRSMKRFNWALLGLLMPLLSLPLPAQITNPSEKLDGLLFFLESYYLEKIDREALIEAALEGLLNELDPHSYYLPPRELKASEEALSGNFEGIGVQFNIHNDTIMVVSPISGGPSERLGIRSGDRIIFIEDTLVAGKKITNNDVFRWLRGKKGSIVHVKILRPGLTDLLDFAIVRDKIPVFSMDAAFMLKPGVGYLKINRFAETTVEEFKEGWTKLKALGAKDLILDLQGNSGGYLMAATGILDQFFPKGKLLVYTQGLHSDRRDFKASGNPMLLSNRLVVLVDEGSASASEIVSGAIQDHDRGMVVGRRTFGKGLVQNTFPMPDGSAFRLTTSRYFTPSGRFIQAPYNEGTEKYFKDLASRFDKGELTDSGKAQIPDSLAFKTSKGRTVYGGAGIMPDVFVPLDTSFFSVCLNRITAAGLPYNVALDYVDAHRAALQGTYPSIDDFNSGFDAQPLWDKLMTEIEQRKLPCKTEDFIRSKVFLMAMLKALVAQNLQSRDAFFQVMASENESIQKALEMLEGPWPEYLK